MQELSCHFKISHTKLSRRVKSSNPLFEKYRRLLHLCKQEKSVGDGWPGLLVTNTGTLVQPMDLPFPDTETTCVVIGSTAPSS
jgi:hypothetical protein